MKNTLKIFLFLISISGYCQNLGTGKFGKVNIGNSQTPTERLKVHGNAAITGTLLLSYYNEGILKSDSNGVLRSQSLISSEIPDLSAIYAYTVNTIADLKARTLNINGDKCYALGYYNRSDLSGGLFYWDSSSTATANDGTIIQANGLSVGRWIRVFSGSVKVRWFGAKGDSTTNDTTPIQNAINTGRNIDLEGFTYKAQNIQLAENQIFDGNGGKIKAISGANPVLKINNKCVVRNLTIDGLKASTSEGSTGIFSSAKSKFTIENCVVFNTFNQGVQVQNSSNFIVKNSLIYGAGGSGATQYQGINMVFCSNAKITGNTVYNCQFGVQYFGADYEYCTNIQITNNIVYNLTGGIWGAWGHNIVVSNNNVSTCADIGIDFEHSYDCVADANYVEECVYGCLATFYGSRNIVFSNNTLKQISAYPAIKIHDNILSKQFNISNNVITSAGVGFDMAVAILKESIISNNVINAIQGGIIIREGNDMMILGNKIITEEFGIKYLGGNNSVIDGNTINKTTTDVSVSAGSFGGITIVWTLTNNTRSNVVSNNVVKGYNFSIVDDCWGDNTSYNLIRNNKCSTIYRRTGGGYAGVITGNLDVINPNISITATTF